jgi:FAD/FMN-containing dehydrogenase
MNRILGVSPYDMQATAQCGVPLQALEDRGPEGRAHDRPLAAVEAVAHMGGLVATRSIGQFSTLYGGIEDMVVGLEASSRTATVARIKNVPPAPPAPTSAHRHRQRGGLCFSPR